MLPFTHPVLRKAFSKRPVGLLVCGICLIAVPSLGTPAFGAGAAVSAGAAAPVSATPEASEGTKAYGPEAPVSRDEVKRVSTEAAHAAAGDVEKSQAIEIARLRDQLLGALASERAAREALDLRLKSLDAAAEKAAARPSVLSGNTQLTLSGFVHADWAFRQSSSDQINPSTGAPLNEDRFLIRRARVKASLDGTFVFGSVEFDGNTVRGPTVRLLSAEASVRWPAPVAGSTPLVALTGGIFKVPFGFEVLQSDRDRLFLERSSVARALFPGEYDLGARLQGGWQSIRYAVAVMNGDPLGESAFPGRDPSHQKDVIGRGGVDSEVSPSVRVSAGVSGLAGTGFHSGTPASKPSLVWQDRNEDGQFQSTEIQLSPGVSPTPSRTFGRHAIGGDARLQVKTPAIGTTTVYGEVYVAQNLDRGLVPADPFGPLGRDLREIGWYGALTQEIGSVAALGVRYDFYNPDRDSTNPLLGKLVPESFTYHSWAFTGALQSPLGRLIAEFDLNRNHLGRSASGEPSNLKDNAFTLRGEVKF